MSNLPEMTNREKHVGGMAIDMTPDEGLPLRILQAYRGGCDCKWLVNMPDKELIYAQMNEDQDKRAAILDKAIAASEQRDNISALRGALVEAMKYLESDGGFERGEVYGSSVPRATWRYWKQLLRGEISE